MIEQARLQPERQEDVTENMAIISQRRHAARLRAREELLALEGAQTYRGQQRFLAMVHQLASERRLSRYALLARNGARGPRSARHLRSKKEEKLTSPETLACLDFWVHLR